LITSVLKTAEIPKGKIDLYLKDIQIFDQAFTHITANPDCNYESLEILGDIICGSGLVFYLRKRFPGLCNPNGSAVKFLARLKINLAAVNTFSEFGRKLGFWDFISADMYVRREKERDLLEDVFESFMGALWTVMDKNDPKAQEDSRILTSIGPEYRILKYLFDPVEISLKYEDLYDPKTRLKELFDYIKKPYPKFDFVQDRTDENKIIFTVNIRADVGDGMKVWGTGKGNRKTGAEQLACEDTITNLRKAGFYKKVEFNML